MRLFLNILFIILLSSTSSNGQDVHFSQIFNSPLNLNPALTGNYNSKFRMVVNNRSQWNSFTNAYKTMSASFEIKNEPRNESIKSIATGILINNDIAGDGNLSSTGFYIPISITRNFINDKLKLSLGIIAGFSQLSIDYSNLYFGTQFNGNFYDPTLPNYESLSNDKTSFFDIGTGINIDYSINLIKISSGFSMYHLNTPQVSYFDNTESYLPVNNTGYMTISFAASPIYNFSLSYINRDQGSFNENLFGALVSVNNNNIYLHSFSTGIFIRNKDALILMSYININDLKIGLSYDINTSSLSNASKGRGGFEFSLIYLFNTTKPSFYYPPKPCPDFI